MTCTTCNSPIPGHALLTVAEPRCERCEGTSPVRFGRRESDGTVRCPACCDGPLDLHDQCANCAWNPSIPLGGQNRNPGELAGEVDRLKSSFVCFLVALAVAVVAWAVLS